MYVLCKCVYLCMYVICLGIGMCVLISGYINARGTESLSQVYNYLQCSMSFTSKIQKPSKPFSFLCEDPAVTYKSPCEKEDCGFINLSCAVFCCSLTHRCSGLVYSGVICT